MRRLRQAALLAGLTLVGLLVVLLTGPEAGASVIRAENSATSGKVTLASTGFNITGPVVAGLGLLVVGIGLVCWAFLRGGSHRRRERRP